MHNATVNFSALVTLAMPGESSTEEQITAAEFGLGDAFEKAMAEEQIEAQKAAVAAIRELNQLTLQTKTSNRTQVRQLRESADALVTEMKNLDRAVAYAKATKNFIPWAALVGKTSYDLGLTPAEFNKKKAIPSDWAPSE